MKAKKTEKTIPNGTVTIGDGDRAITLDGVDIVEQVDGRVVFKAFEFTHIFFISMLRMLDNENIPEELRADVDKALPVLQIILSQVSVNTKGNSTEVVDCNFSLHNLERIQFPDEQTGEPITDPEAIKTRANEVAWTFLQSPGVVVALRMAVLTVRGAAKEKEKQAPIKSEEPADPTEKQLFSNSKSISDDNWGMVKFGADQLGRIIGEATRAKGIAQFESIDPRTRRDSKKPIPYGVTSRDTKTEFLFDPERVAIRSAEQFADQLMRLKDAKVIQTYSALWKWANMHDSAIFQDVPISEVMALILKPGEQSKFNTPQRREFSDVLEYLASITITESIIGERVNPKTGKKKAELRERSGVRLFDMEATYSVKKEFAGLSKSELDENLHFDKTVIARFSGALMPGKKALFAGPASVYVDGLLHMDANKDGKAIMLGFKLQTRFNQFQDKEKYIELDREYLVDICEYQRTNETKPSQATKQILNNLDKLVKAGIISSHSGLGNKSTDRIKIYPPKQATQSTLNG